MIGAGLIVAPVRISAIDDERVEVRLPDHIGCAACASGGGCGAERALIRCARTPTFNVDRPRGCHTPGRTSRDPSLAVGDRAALAVPRLGLWLAAGLLLGAPLLGFLVGAALGGKLLVFALGAPSAQAAGGLLGLVLATVGVRVVQWRFPAPSWLRPKLMLDSRDL